MLDHMKPQDNPKIQVSFPIAAGVVAPLLPETVLWGGLFVDPFPSDTGHYIEFSHK